MNYRMSDNTVTLFVGFIIIIFIAIIFEEQLFKLFISLEYKLNKLLFDIMWLGKLSAENI